MARDAPTFDLKQDPPDHDLLFSPRNRRRARPLHRRPARRQARRGVRCATAGAACSSPEELREEVHAEEHPDDRPHRRRQNRDRPPPGPSSPAPFIKVEATKFTEVGYVGRDVESIVRDLLEAAIGMQASSCASSRGRGRAAAEERVLDALRRPASQRADTRRKLRKMLRDGTLANARWKSQ